VELAVLIINKEEFLETLLEAYIEIGISGSTIIDSIGMGHILASDVPIFAGLRFMFAGSRPYNKTIISVIKEDKIELVKEAVENTLGPLSENGNGILFFIPIREVVGLKSEIK